MKTKVLTFSTTTMSDEDFFDSGERLLNADELAECVTRQKTFSLPVIGQKVKQIVNISNVLASVRPYVLSIEC